MVGDQLVANHFAYGFRWPRSSTYTARWGEPARGDLVIFLFPEDRSKDFIKRVVAVGGDTFEVRQKKVYINGKPVDDPHAYFEDAAQNFQRDNFGPQRVPEKHVFVLGDNRDKSYDSRFWGPLAIDDIKGKAHVIYWSWDEKTRSVRWERIGKIIE
jgi:signal peptidase I